MRILYGIQGTGNGHISRGRLMAEALQQQGAEVDYLFSGRNTDAYFDMDIFGNYQACSGLSFATKKGKVDLLTTLISNKPRQFFNDVKSLQIDDYDLIVSDFEPVTAWAAKQSKRHTLGISHQASFRYGIPQAKSNHVARMTMKHFAPVHQSIGLHWYHFGYPILPPIIEKLTPTNSKKQILVYLPFEAPHEIFSLLSRFKNYEFICFHPETKEITMQQHVTFYPLGRQAFVDVLKGAEGVICNAGFELASEALTLGKRLLLKPLHGQYEQASNALTLEMLGLGLVMETLNSSMVERWLESPSPGKVVYPNVAQALAKWLVSKNKEHITDLSSRLWRQTMFPEPVMEQIHELGMGDDMMFSELIRF